jgi:cytosine/adenosine deaminase-related metal-dependent hydrolase
VGTRVIAVHANYLGPGDAELLARNCIHVAHCPRSHFYFGHARFPLRRLLKAGVNVCLATDSLASVRKRPHEVVELSLFEEMRSTALAGHGLRPAELLRMATRNGARALGLRGKAGEIIRGAFADLIALPCSRTSRAVYDCALEHSGPVAASMIDGQWVIPPLGA